MLNIAAIAAIVSTGALGGLTDAALTDASHAVQFAIDPCHLGSEPHLRCDVETFGISENRLIEIEQAVWAECARRQDARIEANWRQGPAILPMAA